MANCRSIVPAFSMRIIAQGGVGVFLISLNESYTDNFVPCKKKICALETCKFENISLMLVLCFQSDMKIAKSNLTSDGWDEKNFPSIKFKKKPHPVFEVRSKPRCRQTPEKI